MMIITSVVQPPAGAVVAVYCEHCRATEFTVSPYARKPERGDYWILVLPCGLHLWEAVREAMPAGLEAEAVPVPVFEPLGGRKF